jgi:hypothetical protein
MPNLFARKMVSSDQRPHPAPNSTTTKSRIVLVHITKRSSNLKLHENVIIIYK